MNNRSSMHAPSDSQLLKILGVEDAVERKERGAGSKTNSAHSHRSRSGVLSKRGTSVVVNSKQSKSPTKKKGSSNRSIDSRTNSNQAGQKSELLSPMPYTEQLLVTDNGSEDSEDNQDANDSMHGIIQNMSKAPEIFVEELN